MYGWPDLPPDLLREISGYLCSVPNYVRFHAVCRAWRSSHDPARAQSFLPWLLARSTKISDSPLHLRCIFSNKSYIAPVPWSDGWRDWVCGADGATLRYFTADPCLTMHDPLVTGGAPTVMEASFPFPKDQWLDSPSGTIYGDGTILLYKKNYPIRDTGVLKAMILRPGDTAWIVVERKLEYRDFDECPVAYHAGKILFTEGGRLWQWHAIIPGCNDKNVDVVIPTPTSVEQDDYHRFWYEDSYLVESNGELLWLKVSVRYLNFAMCSALSVLVFALEEAPDKKMRWERKSGQSLADRVFFLGSSNSFALDASKLDSSRHDGGCTYFMCYNYDDERSRQRRWCVIRYNLVNDRAKIIEWLPQSWQHERCAWLVLQPTMAPIREIRERLKEASKWKRLQQVVAAVTPRSIIDHNAPLQPCFRILVSNLPLTVDSYQLGNIFSKHGEVYSTKIVCYEKTRTSQGKGFVTLATVHVHRADALATLNRIVWNGNSLKVSDVSEQLRQRPSPTQAARLHIDRSSRS